MGYKKTDKCINNAFPDERLFVLMRKPGGIIAGFKFPKVSPRKAKKK